MSYHNPQSDRSRKVIDTAIGVLVGLRGCSSAHHCEAFNAWGELISQGRAGALAIAG